LKRSGVIPACESVDEDPSGNDLPQAAARVAMRCRPAGAWVALHLACIVRIPHRLSLLHVVPLPEQRIPLLSRSSEQVLCQPPRLAQDFVKYDFADALLK
jgi:hypothetical protein